MRISKILVLMILIFSLSLSFSFADSYTYNDLSLLFDVVSGGSITSNTITWDYASDFKVIPNINFFPVQFSNYVSSLTSGSYPNSCLEIRPKNSSTVKYRQVFSSSVYFSNDLFSTYPLSDYDYYLTRPHNNFYTEYSLNYTCSFSSSYNNVQLIPFTGEGINVPAGFCCVIDRAFNDVVSTQTYSPLPDYAYLTCTTNEKSPVVGDWVTGASYGYQNTLDLSNISSLNTITWSINPNKEKTGLFNNRSYNAFKEIITNTSSRYILISNPPYSNYSSENNTFVSPTITINFVNYDGTPYHGFCGWYKLYRYDSLNNHSYVISEDNPIPWKGEENESGDGYTIQGWGDDFTTPSPQLGGTPISSSDSSDGLISTLSQYFGLGQEKVDNLVNQGNGFFSFLSNLFSWMPSELISIVSSVFIIFLVVACIKLFL